MTFDNTSAPCMAAPGLTTRNCLRSGRAGATLPNPSDIHAQTGRAPLDPHWTHDGPVAGRSSPTQATVREAAEALRGLLAAVDVGELDVATPREVALLRRLQGTLVGWEETLGERPPPDDHGRVGSAR